MYNQKESDTLLKNIQLGGGILEKIAKSNGIRLLGGEKCVKSRKYRIVDLK